MLKSSYSSSDYPSLTHLVEIKRADFIALRNLLIKEDEMAKFVKWQEHKFIRIKETL